LNKTLHIASKQGMMGEHLHLWVCSRWAWTWILIQILPHCCVW